METPTSRAPLTTIVGEDNLVESYRIHWVLSAHEPSEELAVMEHGDDATDEGNQLAHEARRRSPTRMLLPSPGMYAMR